MTKEEKSSYLNSIDEACQVAESQGLFVVNAEPDMLLVDLDNLTSRDMFIGRVQMLYEIGLVISHTITISKSGKWHGYARTSCQLNFLERICLQCVLGSDLNHEYLSALAHFASGRNMDRMVLFEKSPGDPLGQCEAIQVLKKETFSNYSKNSNSSLVDARIDPSDDRTQPASGPLVDTDAEVSSAA